MHSPMAKFAKRCAGPAMAAAIAALLPAAAFGADAPATTVSRPAAALAARDARDTVVVDPETDKIIKGAIKFLASQQKPTGAWTSPNGEHPVAVTGYTLMAMLASGQLPGEGEYGKQVTAGVNYLLMCVRDDGYVTSESTAAGRRSSNMYDHGVAMIALAEVYGQTQDVKLKAKLESCIRLVISAQSREGGWRYAPRPIDADISVTVLQVVALRACKNAGLDVPQTTIDNAVRYVKTCSDERSGGFTYQPRNNAPGFARTAAAIYSLQVCGAYDDPLVKRGSDYLLNRGSDKEYFTYGHFYAAPAQYMVGGDTWSRWYDKLKTELLPKVKKDGDVAFWDEIDHRGIGAVYATAVYTMTLSMPYHYVPLYQR
jgi:hypothetical protein